MKHTLLTWNKDGLEAKSERRNFLITFTFSFLRKIVSWRQESAKRRNNSDTTYPLVFWSKNFVFEVGKICVDCVNKITLRFFHNSLA